MNSSISSSDAQSGAQSETRPDPGAWRRFAERLLATALFAVAVAYGFVAVIDPWGMLPLSPPLPRVPVSTNARFSFPALAVSPRFDSIVLGTSTSRLLRPARLDPAFGARFANLAMNSATAYEQSRMLRLFLRAHAAPRAVLIGLDAEWCRTGSDYARFTPREFPEWMYHRNRWAGYLALLNAYAVQEAASQFAVMVGLKRRRYGLDGYTNFTPPESQYDAARALGHIAAEPPETLGFGEMPDDARNFPTHALLHDDLARLPPQTRKLLFFVPIYRASQGAPGSLTERLYAECKRRITRIAETVPGTVVADFMIDSPITRDPANYWDPKHYRTMIADRLVHDLALVDAGQAAPEGDDALLLPARLTER